MTKSHKIIVFVPPVLIACTILMVFFAVQHSKNQGALQGSSDGWIAITTDDYRVDKELPPTATTTPPDTFTSSNMVACTMDAKQCPDGSFVGRTGPDCEFKACPNTATSTPVETCRPQSRQAEVCIEIYAPVCGQKQVQCVTEPCDPLPTTYSNSCFACMDQQVQTYTEGVCTTDTESEYSNR